MHTYYTLATFEDDGQWHPQFGDYDRSVVHGEYVEYRDQGYGNGQLAVFCSGDDQESIDAGVAMLNARTLRLAQRKAQ